ncbi:hypothetical protein [Haloplanus sp. C73]|uniref:hypothetical protein n=1 Tax=Haloplanus sp. C73 TaxID=3421641 RepID=UPI003EBE44CA
MGITNAALYGGIGGVGGLGGLYVAYANPTWFLAALAVVLLASVLYIYQLEPAVSDTPLRG